MVEAPSPLAGRSFDVTSLSLGYAYGIRVADHAALELGGMGTVNLLPAAIKPAYGGSPFSTMLFTRLKLR